ncbi:hypothetical protein ACS0YX_30215, partial [Burkholderia gladioli]
MEHPAQGLGFQGTNAAMLRASPRPGHLVLPEPGSGRLGGRLAGLIGAARSAVGGGLARQTVSCGRDENKDASPAGFAGTTR